MSSKTASIQQDFHIYGRKSYPQPLTFIATLQIKNTANAAKIISQTVVEDDWIELVAFPEQAIVQVLVEGNVR